MRGRGGGGRKANRTHQNQQTKISNSQLLNPPRAYSSPWQPVSLQASSVLNPVVSEKQRLTAFPGMISILD